MLRLRLHAAQFGEKVTLDMSPANTGTASGRFGRKQAAVSKRGWSSMPTCWLRRVAPAAHQHCALRGGDFIDNRRVGKPSPAIPISTWLTRLVEARMRASFDGTPRTGPRGERGVDPAKVDIAVLQTLSLKILVAGTGQCRAGTVFSRNKTMLMRRLLSWVVSSGTQVASVAARP